MVMMPITTLTPGCGKVIVKQSANKWTASSRCGAMRCGAKEMKTTTKKDQKKRVCIYKKKVLAGDVFNNVTSSAITSLLVSCDARRRRRRLLSVMHGAYKLISQQQQKCKYNQYRGKKDK